MKSMDEENISFPFPFKPYDVQVNFMKNLYFVLQSSNIGIFESPTGTGKSLSIICGSLKWLKDFQDKQKEELKSLLEEEISDCNEDWFNAFLDKQDKSHKLQDAKKEYAFLTEYENRIKNLRKIVKYKNKIEIKGSMPCIKRQKYEDRTDEEGTTSDDDFIVDDEQKSDDDNDVKEDKRHVLKIYYASRTHSQLSQFLGEIKRSPYNNQVTVTTLGSRTNFCINKAVAKLKNLSLINEHCVDLQRQKNSAKKCPYIRNLSEMQNSILASVRDIEEIVQIGAELKSCPYYSTRSAIPEAEIVLLPYNILLHKPTREAYGIILKDNIVIIDEAHNLVEAINNMYSVEISGIVLEQCLWQLEAYNICYQTRLSRENLRYIKLLITVLKCLIKGLKNISSSKILLVSDFFCTVELSNVNIFEIVKYCDQSLISQKVHGFTAARVAKGITPVDDQQKNNEAPKQTGISNFLSQIKNKKSSNTSKIAKQTVIDSTIQYKPSAIFTFIEFLKTLTFPTKDGRILINKTSELTNSSLKFLHLNPASHFQDIVLEARSVILAGGTMQPVTEFTDQLFLPAGIPKDRIHIFSCGHVIPSENLLAISLASGPCGNTLDFTFKNRKSPHTIKELGSVLLNICSSVHGGIVCFFPSYEYEEFIFNELTKNKMLHSIEKKCKVFREPKLSCDVDKVLSEYAKCISSCSKNNLTSPLSGALLFSIVGGKMSEGINFSDDLGRCVIMVGLPYPNKFSIELQEKMSYLNQQQKFNGKTAGDVYYNNLCMKAVNQSIGRAIRHRNDYASIILLDYRYNNAIVKDALPSWISKSLSFHQKFGSAYMSLRKFFASKRNL